MSFEPVLKQARICPLDEAKLFISKGNFKGALDKLREYGKSGNAMACFDAGLMLAVGIGCKASPKAAIEIIKIGSGYTGKGDWKSDESILSLLRKNAVTLRSLFWLNDMMKNVICFLD